jgi:hypothetical protein
MKRNNFLKAITASSVGATLLNSTDAKASIEAIAPKKTLMTVGCQSGGMEFITSMVDHLKRLLAKAGT